MTKKSRPRRVVNPIDVIEAGYELERDDRDWLRNLTAVIRPLVEGGRGVSAYTFDIATPMKTWFRDELTFDMSPRQLELQRAFQIAGAEKSEAMHFDPEPLGVLVRAAQRAGLGNLLEDPGIREQFRAMGVRDYIAFRTIEPGGKGICINGGQIDERSFDRRTMLLWARVAAHIAAARRLRSALAAASDERAIEAVLTPSGRLEHAEADGKSQSARTALREAVVRQETARGRKGRDAPELAIEAWTALVSGRWSLIDRYEHGGRRYIVARRNEHALPDPRALTARERTVIHLTALGKTNKLIAYELGLSTSTVATYLAAAMRKLRVSSRVELIQLARQLGHP